ncbi:hypothetical protein B0H19DRAFT_1146407 [Mycena capillaripes]|nr:hypothetical protein B0H19DRAFT_1146407 [Mycena capillaripes]
MLSPLLVLVPSSLSASVSVGLLRLHARSPCPHLRSRSRSSSRLANVPFRSSRQTPPRPRHQRYAQTSNSVVRSAASGHSSDSD